MHDAATNQNPKLRPLEAFANPDSVNGEVVVRDAAGLSDVMLTMSLPALHILELMDGTRGLEDIRCDFQQQYGHAVAADTLTKLVQHLTDAHLLEGESFEAYYTERAAQYAAQPARIMRDAAALGLHDASGELFNAMLAQHPVQKVDGRVVGLVAPHLDYPRGAPCYAKSYGSLRDRPVPDRVIVLGTNHFGRSTSVVTTGLDFETPFGRTPTDAAFIEALERRCGSLRTFEMDHAREHSVELQVAWLQHLLGPNSFELVPILCPDPCGPTGMDPLDGRGVNLNKFVEALKILLAAEDADTLVVAGADLSHVGRSFGDESDLDHDFLAAVRDHDTGALDHYGNHDAVGFVEYLAQRKNATRVCSAGCMYVAASCLADARPAVLEYHQAVDRDSHTCVTCTSVVFTRT